MPKSWVKTAEMVVGNLILTISVFSLQASDEGNVSGWEQEGEGVNRERMEVGRA